MINRFALQASNPVRKWARETGGDRRAFNSFIAEAEYPVVPPGWPNRETRRAVKQGREHRLSTAWRQVLVARPSLRAEIRGL